MLSMHDVPGQHAFRAHVPAQAANAATADLSVWVAPYKIRATAFRLVVGTAVTGTDTDSRNINIKKIVPGGATTEVAHLDLEDGTDLAVGRNTLPLNSGTYVDFNAGDLVVVEGELVGEAGLAVGIAALEIVAAGN